MRRRKAQRPVAGLSPCRTLQRRAGAFAGLTRRAGAEPVENRVGREGRGSSPIPRRRLVCHRLRLQRRGMPI